MADMVLRGCKLIRVAALDADGGIPASPTWLRMDNPQQVSMNPVLVAGQESELRGGDELVGTITEPDKFRGMDINMVNATVDGAVLPTVCGGSWNGTTEVYTAPKVADDLPLFMMEVYVARYGTGQRQESNIVGYIKFTFNSCVGSHVNYSAQDRAFMVPNMNIKARENVVDSLPSYKWEKVAALP